MSQQVSRPQLLFLSHVLPYPPDRGVAIRTYNVLRQLAAAFDITMICFYRWKGGRLQRDIDASVRHLEKYCKVSVFPIPQEHSRPRWLTDHLRSSATLRQYMYYGFWSRDYAACVDSALAENTFDLVHVDSMLLNRYIFRIPKGTPVICGHHNVESSLLRRRAKRVDGKLASGYLRFQAWLVERMERELCSSVSLNVAVSDLDHERFQQLAPSGRYTVVPNGVDVEYFQPSERVSGQSGITFVGGTDWFPNRDALEHYVEDIMPRLADSEPPVAKWIGRVTGREADRYGDYEGLELTGFVDDIRPHVRKAACYIVPIRVGGGTRLKILDAWAMGKAVVSTSIGCEGLKARDGENVLIRDDPTEFAEAVKQVLRDEKLRTRLGRAARLTAEHTYSWEVIGKHLVEEYRSVMAMSGRSAVEAAPRGGSTARRG